MATPNDELADGYADAMVDGDYVTEFQEGSNRGKFMTPRDLRDLIAAKDEAAASARKRSAGIFKRVVD